MLPRQEAIPLCQRFRICEYVRESVSDVRNNNKQTEKATLVAKFKPVDRFLRLQLLSPLDHTFADLNDSVCVCVCVCVVRRGG